MLRDLQSVLKTEYAADVPIHISIKEGLDIDEILKVVLQALESYHMKCQRGGE